MAGSQSTKACGAGLDSRESCDFTHFNTGRRADMVDLRFLVPPQPHSAAAFGQRLFLCYSLGMKSPDEIKVDRAKMIEHLEHALALADGTGDYATSYLIEQALDSARADQWPNLDPRFDTKQRKR